MSKFLRDLTKDFAPLDSMNLSDRHWPMNRRGLINSHRNELNKCDFGVSIRQAKEEPMLDRRVRKVGQNPNSKAGEN